MFRLAIVGVVAVVTIARAGLISPAPEHNAGEARTGQVLVHDFVLHNPTDAPLDIVRIKAGCGCLGAVPAKTRLAPGEKTTLRLTVNTVTQAVGPNTWRAVVHHHQQGRDAELVLSLNASLRADLSITPATVVLHTSAGLSHSFTLTEHRDTPVSLRAVSCVSPHVRVQPGPARQHNGSWVRSLAVQVLPTLPEGRHEDALIVLTTDSGCPELRVPFSIIKHSAEVVQASPASVEAYRGTDGSVPSRIVYLHARGEAPVRVQSIKVGHPALKATWANGPGSRATLRIVIDGDAVGPAGLTSDLLIEIAGPTPQTLRLPVEVRSQTP